MRSTRRPTRPDWQLIRGDAFHLPLREGVVDVIIADPPYEGTARGKRRVPARKVGYIPFSGRGWFPEAWRVLKPGGHLYLVCSIKESQKWRVRPGQLVDTICWMAPNAASLSAHWRRGIGGRSPVWQPILHYQKPPRKPIVWPDGYVFPNYIEASRVQSNMKESLPWPNQLPMKLLLWLLAPHHGLVLDLFSGTGSAGRAATALGLAVVSVEASSEALSLARQQPIPLPLFP
jgi:DNA modification methylase